MRALVLVVLVGLLAVLFPTPILGIDLTLYLAPGPSAPTQLFNFLPTIFYSDTSLYIVLEEGKNYTGFGSLTYSFNRHQYSNFCGSQAACPSSYSYVLRTEIIGNHSTIDLGDGGFFGNLVQDELIISNLTFSRGGRTDVILRSHANTVLTLDNVAFERCSRPGSFSGQVLMKNVSLGARYGSSLFGGFYLRGPFDITGLNITGYTSNSLGALRIETYNVGPRNIQQSTFVDNIGSCILWNAYWLSYQTSTLKDLVFWNNAAGPPLLFNSGSTNFFMLYNLVLVDNSCGFDTGGIVARSGARMHIVNSTFDGNSGTSAGALDAARSGGLWLPSILLNCTFIRNYAVSNGGAVTLTSVQYSGFSIQNCTFVDNSAVGNGGAVSVSPGSGGDVVYFTGCLFESNVAGRNGGALDCSNQAVCIVTSSSFIDNEGVSGGAISVFATPYDFQSTALFMKGNTASSIGGALFCFSSFCRLELSVLQNNTASTGAAIYALFTEAAVVLSDVSMSGHKGPVIVAFLAEYLLMDSIAIFDNEDGALSIVETPLTMFSCIVTRNGGPSALDIATAGPDTNIYDSFIGGNAGFGIGCSGGQLSVLDTIVCQNGEESEFDCSDGCAANATAGSLCSSGAALCAPTCSGTGFYIPEVDTNEFSGPYYGCHTSISPCEVTPGVCSAFAVCDDAANNGYSCSCPVGFTGTGYPANPCADIDECLAGPDICPLLSVCENTVGSFMCNCGSGAETVNGTCVDINECLLGACGVGANCNDTEGSFVCWCPLNWYGDATVSCTLCPGVSSLPIVGGPFLEESDCVCADDYFTDPANFPGVCVPCPPGFYVVGPECFPCINDTYNPLASQPVCIGCGTRRVSPPASASFAACVCQPGYVEDGFGACAANCSLGQYRPTADSSCLDCQKDKYADVANLPECRDCPPFSITNGATKQVSIDSCQCRANFTWIDAGDRTRGCGRECPPGTYRPVADAPCTPCPLNTYNNLPNQFVCPSCPVYSNTNGVTGATSSEACVCDEGFEGSPVCLRQCRPGTRYKNEASPCEPCPPNTYNPDVRSPECLACPENAICGGNSTALTDCTCAPGFYTPERVAGTPCLPCPEGGTCLGGVAYPIADYGYAPVEGEDGIASFAECVPESACLGNGACQVGYTGSLCEACDSNVEGTPYYRLSGNCIKCRQNPAIIVFALYGVLFLVQCLLVAVNSQDRVLNRFASLIIGLNSLQITAQYGRLDVEWPPLAQKFFDILSIANFNLELVAPECAVPVGDPFVLRWLATMFFPILLFFNFLVIWATFCAFHYVAHQTSCFSVNFLMSLPTIKAARHTAIRSMYQIMMIAYLPLSAAVFELFDCPRNGYGQRVIQTSRSTQCYTGVYWVLFPFGLFFLLLYPIGMPIFYYKLLRMKLANLGNIKFHIRYGFLVGRFSPEYYLFELAIMLRKLLVVLCMSFLTKSAFIKAGGAIIVLLTSYLIHQETLPYRSDLYNGMESACIFCAILVLLLSMLFDDPNFSEGAKSGLIVTVLFINLLVILIGIGFDSWRLYKEEEEADEVVTKADEVYDNAVAMSEEEFNQIAMTEMASSVGGPGAERSFAAFEDPDFPTLRYPSSSSFSSAAGGGRLETQALYNTRT